MNFKAIFLAVAMLFLAGSAFAYYPYGGSYGALEYPNSYYNVYSAGYATSPYGGYSYYNNYTPYSSYSYYSSWQPSYATYYTPVYYTASHDKEFYWNGFGFNFAYLKNYR